MGKPDRIAVFLGHPAHFHMFKHMVAELESRGIGVDYLVKRKDMLEELVQRSGHRYFVVRSQVRTAKGRLGLAKALIDMELNMVRYILRRRPRLVIGTYAPVLSHLTRVPFIVCCEDDTSVVSRFARTSYPYAKAILAPKYCNGGQWDAKMTKYAGFQKLAYLHPNWFVPRFDVVEPYLRHPERPFAVLRFAQLQAHHDEGVHGMSNQLALRLVEKLSPTYDVYITSERKLDPGLEPFRLDINPLDIHHWMAYASIYIGDSQSMAVEAAMLGTPSVRFSDFAHRIGVLNALEERYKLTVGIPSDDEERLFQVIDQLAGMPDLRSEFQRRRQAMLAEQIDVTRFFTDFVLSQLCTTLPRKNTVS